MRGTGGAGTDVCDGAGAGAHWSPASCLLISSSDAYWLTQGDNLQPSKQQRASMAGPNDLFFGEGGIVIEADLRLTCCCLRESVFQKAFLSVA